MATFTVDAQTLEHLSSTLSTIQLELEAIQAAPAGYDGLLGGSDLEDEVHHFCTHWGYGIHQIGDNMTGVVARLNAAARTYSTSEQYVGDACGQGG